MAIQVKQIRTLTRREVRGMLNLLPTNDTELLEIMLGILTDIATSYFEVNLQKATDYLLDIADGYETQDKDTDKYIRAKRYFVKHNLWVRIEEDMDNLYN